MNNPRAVAYIRVSTERDDMVSPELQMTAIEAHCAKRGFEIVKTLEDLDLSGKFWKRRTVEQGIAMIERGEAEALVVWKISRVARNRRDWAIALDRVESIGGMLESAMEPMDTSTSSGRFARGMLAELAVYESEQIGDSWKAAHARRIKMGLPHHGLPRFGYNYTKADGYTPDEAAGPVLREMYVRFIRGATMRELGAYAASEGFDKEAGWRIDNTRRMLDRGFAAGYIYSKGELIKGAHEPVITEAEWQAYQSRREARSGRPRAEASDYAYSGLLRCYCGARMAGSALTGHNGKRYQRYVCTGGQQKGTSHGVTISAQHVEDAVLKWLKGVSAELDKAAQGVNSVPKAPNLARKKAQIGAEIIKNAARLDALTIRSLDGEISKEVFDRLSAKFVEEAAALEARHRLLEVNATVKPAAIVPELLKGWTDAPARLKRETLASLVTEIRLHDWESEVHRGRRAFTVTPVWE